MKNKGIEWNFPLWLLLMILTAIVWKALNLLAEQNQCFFFLNLIMRILAFFLVLYIMIYTLYYIQQILVSKCWNCERELENRGRKVMLFLMTPPWKKRKVKFICRDCKKSYPSRMNDNHRQKKDNE